MFKIKSINSLMWNVHTMSIKLIIYIFLFIFIAVPTKTQSNKIIYSQNGREPFLTNVLQEDKNISNPTNKLVCFYVITEAINPDIMDTLCTHIIVGFFSINKTTNKLEVSTVQEQIITKVTLLKKKSKDLKVLISIGGAGEMSFNSMVLNHITRKIFIKSCFEFIKKFQIDGIDLDWEWPVVNNGNVKEKIKYVQLLQEIRGEFNRHKKKYFLSADVPSSKLIIELGFYVRYISDYVDFVSVMCYDYHYFTKLFPFTGHNAPLYSSNIIFSSDSNINSSIYLWISKGMPREKIMLGIPTYGHTFKLTFPGLHSVLAPAKGYGSIGQYGFADYIQICQFLKNKNTVTVFDEVSKTPYAYQFSEWVSFDNERSLALKTSYVLQEKLGGVFIFSVNADDYKGSCRGDNIPLPLIRKVRNILFNKV